VAGSEMIVECDSVLLATGQQSDLSFIRPEDAVEVSDRGRIVTDDATLATAAPGIFAGGDVVFGPRTIIEAVADGHRAAKAIHSYLTQGQSKLVRRGWMVEVPPEEFPDPIHRESPRVDPPKQALDRRTGISEVEAVYDDETARRQAKRCLQCNIQTVFDGDLCILCGGCVDVCPNNCLKLVPADELTGSGELASLIAGRDDTGSLEEAAGVPLSAVNGGGIHETGTAIIKDETRCTRCGLCRNRCPVGAITMEAIWFEEELLDTRAVR
jgi:formate dehydrogenase beta subunit